MVTARGCKARRRPGLPSGARQKHLAQTTPQILTHSVSSQRLQQCVTQALQPGLHPKESQAVYFKQSQFLVLLFMSQEGLI